MVGRKAAAPLVRRKPRVSEKPARRLRGAIRSGHGAGIMAVGVIILDTFAQAAPYVIKEKLQELRHIFTSAP